MHVDSSPKNIALASFVLGSLFTAGLLLRSPLALYTSLLTLFHFIEFYITELYRPSDLSFDSFLLFHSNAYTAAVALGFIEHFCLSFVFDNSSVSWLGFVIAVAGLGVRAAGMITCGQSFNHHVQYVKSDTHTLVTTGIYKYLRHPSYTGYFYFSLGLMVMLKNPVSVVVYWYALKLFFEERIEEEEMLLGKMYVEYETYRQSTYVMIPFLSYSSSQ